MATPEVVTKACSLAKDADPKTLLRFRVEADHVVIITHEGKKYVYALEELPVSKKPTTTRKS